MDDRPDELVTPNVLDSLRSLTHGTGTGPGQGFLGLPLAATLEINETQSGRPTQTLHT